VAEKLAAQGLTLLYAMPRARNGFATSKPLTSIADFAGQSIRTISINGDRFAEILGANRPDIAFMDVPEAVESGQLAVWVTQPRYVILAGEMGGDIAHYTDAALTQQKLVVIANSDAVEALPEDVRAGLFEAAAAAEARGWEMSEKAREANIAKLKRNGVTVSTASPAFAAELEKIGERMFTEWAKTAGMDGLRLLAAYKSKSKGPGGGN
jgi:TRAP-type C4-dicarboxylate transport system substrate-binding protein